jgi:hypothetical protein
MLAGDGKDHRRLALSLRKSNLARLLSRQVAGIFLADYEQRRDRDPSRFASLLLLKKSKLPVQYLRR